MTCNVQGLSPYQKEVVKTLGKHCQLIPHRVERANTNHLKILIDGVDKPIFASSTPSDQRAIKNFESDLRAALRDRAIKEGLSAEDDCEEPLSSRGNGRAPLAASQVKNRDRFVLNCVNGIKKRVEKLAKDELAYVKERGDVGVIGEFRSREASKTFEYCLKTFKGLQFDNKETKDIILFLVDHFNFHLPSRAHYAEILSPKEAKKSEEQPQHPQSLELSVTQESAAQEVEEVSIDPLTEIMMLRKMERVSLLRGLDYKKAQILIDDIKAAMSKNRDEDLSRISQIMNDSGISIEDIQGHIGK